MTFRCLCLGLGIASVVACSQPLPRVERSQPGAPVGSESALRAPFTLTLRGPATGALPAGALPLTAELRLPEGARAPLTLSLQVQTPAGVKLSTPVPAQLTLSPGDGVRALALDFDCASAPTPQSPIVVIARYASPSGVLGATAEQHYPPPPAAPSPGPPPTGEDPAQRRIGVLPIGQPVPIPP